MIESDLLKLPKPKTQNLKTLNLEFLYPRPKKANLWEHFLVSPAYTRKGMEIKNHYQHLALLLPLKARFEVNQQVDFYPVLFDT